MADPPSGELVASFEAPRTAAQAIALLQSRQPTQVRLLANRSGLTAAPGELTIVLDRLLLDVAPRQRRRVWADEVRHIADALQGLTSLTIEQIRLGDDAIEDVLRRSPQIATLHLAGCQIDDAGALAIAEHAPYLTTLDLAGNRIGEDGARAIAMRLPDLTTLDLAGNRIGEDGARAIAMRLPDLTALHVGGNRIGNAGAKIIARRLPNLTTLDLEQNQISEDGARSIAEGLAKLTSLDLGQNQIGEVGARFIARLPNLTSLHLRGCYVGDDGARLLVESLPDLTALHLGGNHVGVAGTRAIAEHLSNLTELNLWQSTFGDVGVHVIAENLSNLTELNLWESGIGEHGARAIAEHLSNLTSLHLGGNNVGEAGARSVAENLFNLNTLYLWDEEAGEAGVRAIAEHLPNLTSLYLPASRVGDAGAEAIAEHHPNLTSLHLGRNHIGDAGARAIAEHLSNLTGLHLWDNQVGDAGARAIAERLRNLTDLNLENSRIGTAGGQAIAAYLPNLTRLQLGPAEIGSIGARAIAEQLPNLTDLELRGCGIGEGGMRSLLDALAFDDGSRLRRLELGGNPGVAAIGLPELAESYDARAFLANYRRLVSTDEADKVAFGEAKLVVLGNEAVGKTSLVRALADGERSDPNEARTTGVNHRIWVTPWSPSAEGTTQLNIWDFGGQEIMHQTHRYFLTERCIHLIVLDRRKQDDTSVYTWLQTVAHRSPNSPVVIVVNKCDDGTHNLDVDFARLRREHPEIVDVFPVSCSPDEDVMTLEQSIAPLRSCLEDLLANDERLSSVRLRVPKAWVRVRDDVRVKARRTQVLGADEFVNLCQDGDEAALRVTDPDDQRGLLRLLHQIGAVVAHGLTSETNTLAGLTLLDPNWFTDAVYALLDYGVAEFDRNDLGHRLRRDPDRAALYSDSRLDYIIDLLQQPDFALAFRLPGDADPPRFLLPEALTPTAPTSIAGWDSGSLRFRFRYERLPRGLIPQFQVISHQHAGPRPERWRAGCTLKVQGCPVLIDGQLADSSIDILVAGAVDRRRDALAVVRDLFDLVHLRMPESSPSARVPLPDNPEVDVGYDHLRTLASQLGPRHRFLPEGAAADYAVGDLLNGVRSGRAFWLNTDEPPPIVGGGLSRGADGAQIGGAVGATLGSAGAALYLLGQDNGWPVEALLAGAGIGTVAGALLGLLIGSAWRNR